MFALVLVFFARESMWSLERAAKQTPKQPPAAAGNASRNLRTTGVQICDYQQLKPDIYVSYSPKREIV